MEWLMLLGLVVLVVIFSLTGYVLPVPEAAQSHTGPGLVGKYGMRQILLVLFLMAVAIDAALLMWSRFPDLYRYPVPLTATNVGAQYYLAKIMLNGEVCMSTAYFGGIMVFIYEVRIKIADPLFVFMTVLGMSSMAAGWLLYYLVARRYR